MRKQVERILRRLGRIISEYLDGIEKGILFKLFETPFHRTANIHLK